MSMYRLAKRAAFRGIEMCGGFRMCDRLMIDGLHILCYHGISLFDEDRFAPGVFMSPELFAARMDWLAKNDFQPLPLAEAVTRLKERTLPPRAVVITFDDGWFGCLEGAFAKLQSLGWPATLYATTYYAEHGHPVFNVAVHYLLWKTRVRTLDLRILHPGLAGVLGIASAAQQWRATRRIVDFAIAQLTREERRELLYALATHLGLNPVELFERRRLMTLLRLDELRESAARGISIQLHTHRHRFPRDEPSVRRELSDNRAVLEACGFSDLVHLCYPSGRYDPLLLPVLRAANIRTATTSDPGVNFPEADPLLLTRFLDSGSAGEIEFAGEMFGVGHMLRGLRSSTRRVARGFVDPAAAVK
ncbi:MAG: polysaccharide deacetylase family protein [Gammaproteobacteria bacterium]|nr:polysaccharide deacetylase family protein [Gammaproteobacteria bacterium]